jgi:hypothetical protein
LALAVGSAPVPVPVTAGKSSILLTSPSAAIAALAFHHALVSEPAALGILVAEPGRDLVAGAFEKAPLLATAAGIITLVAPSCAFITREIPRVVTVICHIRPPEAWIGTGRDAGPSKVKKRTGRDRRSC